MTRAKVLIQGGGGHGKVVLDCLHDMGVEVVGVVDTKNEGNLLGVQRYRAVDSGFAAEAGMIIAIGDNQVRKQVAAASGRAFQNAIHPTALVSKHATVGRGCMILHHSVIQAGATLGDHVIVNTGAQVDHDCVVAGFVHLAPRTTLCGNVSIGEGTLIGAGAVVIPGKKIGAWCVIGAGAVVISDIPDFSVAVGNPARVIKQQKHA
jgi:sugar O-acyltransferase (sialic acid O-acetyltransferase NeuD family)